MKPLCLTGSKHDLFIAIQLFCSGIVFGLWNNISTIINAKTLLDYGYPAAAGLSLTFLFFPGVVTSVGFLVFHTLGHKKIGRLPPAKVILYFFVLLLFYPILPVIL